MRFEEALEAMLKGKKAKRACYGTPIAYSQKRHKFCFLYDDASGIDGTHYGCEVEFSQSDRVADDWCVISDTPLGIIKAMEEIKTKTLERISKETEKKAKENVPLLTDEESFNRLEITFKSGETITYNRSEWDDYAYDGGAVIVKHDGAWIGIYNFDNVFCVELKK